MGGNVFLPRYVGSILRRISGGLTCQGRVLHFYDRFSQRPSLRAEKYSLKNKGEKLQESEPSEYASPINKIPVTLRLILSFCFAALCLVLIGFCGIDRDNERPFIGSYTFWSALSCGSVVVLLGWSLIL